MADYTIATSGKKLPENSIGFDIESIKKATHTGLLFLLIVLACAALTQAAMNVAEPSVRPKSQSQVEVANTDVTQLHRIIDLHISKDKEYFIWKKMVASPTETEQQISFTRVNNDRVNNEYGNYFFNTNNQVERPSLWIPSWLEAEASPNHNRLMSFVDFKMIFEKYYNFKAIQPQAAPNNWQSGLINAILVLLVYPDQPNAEITKQPDNIVVLESEPATFNVEASGEQLTYQWQVNGIDIPGANSASYTMQHTALFDHGKLYRCVIGKGRRAVTSDSAELQVEMDVPPNDVEVNSLTVVWQQDKAVLGWQQSQDGMRYQIHRGPEIDNTQSIGETASITFQDNNPAYNYHWQYRVATIKDYTHPVLRKYSYVWK